MIECAGLEMKQFLLSSEFWGENTYYDDARFIVNGNYAENGIGVKELKDDDVVAIEDGYVFCAEAGENEEPSLEEYFLLWKSRQSTATIIATCPLHLVDLIKDAIIKAGGQVK